MARRGKTSTNHLLFSIRGMRLAHMNNAKSREHAHTCRKARAIFKLRYKKQKKKNAFTGSIDLGRLPESMKSLNVHYNQLSGSLKLGNLPDTLTEFYAIGNEFSGSVDLTRLPAALSWLNLSQNQLSADPTKGHLSVVGWTSTPVLGEAKNLFKPLVVFLSWRRPY